MKLSVKELEVETYSSQISENELTEIKGGTGVVCETIISWFVTETLDDVDEAMNGDNNSDNGDGDGHTCQSTTTTVNSDGCIVNTTTVITNGN